jgi:hypothetical protein
VARRPLQGLLPSEADDNVVALGGRGNINAVVVRWNVTRSSATPIRTSGSAKKEEQYREKDHDEI